MLCGQEARLRRGLPLALPVHQISLPNLGRDRFFFPFFGEGLVRGGVGWKSREVGAKVRLRGLVGKSEKTIRAQVGNGLIRSGQAWLYEMYEPNPGGFYAKFQPNV